jgi:hypothetical protein
VQGLHAADLYGRRGLLAPSRRATRQYDVADRPSL